MFHCFVCRFSQKNINILLSIGEKKLSLFQYVCIEVTEIRIKRVIPVYKNIHKKFNCYKNGIHILNFLCTESHKKLWVHYVLWL